MLSYNTGADDHGEPACSDPDCNAHRTARRAHTAHAMVLGLHAVCCGLPIAATLLASGAVGLVGLAAFETLAVDLHDRIHQYEGWILAVSAALVVVGGLAELAARRRGLRRFPAFFAVSVVCLAVNAALVVSHRVHHDPVQVAAVGQASASPSTDPVLPASADTGSSHDHEHDHDHGGHDHAH